jgi:uncharacterized membrane protein
MLTLFIILGVIVSLLDTMNKFIKFLKSQPKFFLTNINFF